MAKTIVAKTWALGVDSGGKRRTKPPEDVTAPTVPSPVTATVISTTSILVTSGLSSDAQSGVTEYIFEFRISGVGSYVEHGRAPQPLTSVSYLVDGLASSTGYDIRVKAVDGSGNISNPSAVVTRTTLTGSVPTGFNPNSPRLGAVLHGGFDYETLANRQHWSKFNIVSFGAYNKWESGRSMTLQQVIADMKSRSPWVEGMLGFNYTKYDQCADNLASNAADRRIMDYLNTHGQWVYDVGTSGAKTIHSYQRETGNYKVTNHTAFCPLVSGKTFQEWYIDLVITQMVTGETGNSSNNQLDGFTCDNQMAKPLWNGDYDRNGVAELQTDLTKQLWTRNAVKHWYDTVRIEWPTARYQIGNLTSFGLPAAATNPVAGIPDGGLMEGMIGKTYSPEYYGSFQQLGEIYRKIEDVCRSPKLCIFMDSGNTSTGYARLRYGLSACLVLGNAYYFPGGNNYNTTNQFWYDEFDDGGNGVGWLGQPVEPRQTVARYNVAVDGQGVWRRDYENGIVLCAARRGPRGKYDDPDLDQTTPYTGGASLGGTFYRIDGAQDPTVNSGASLTTLPAMVPRTGLLLRRTAP